MMTKVFTHTLIPPAKTLDIVVKTGDKHSFLAESEHWLYEPLQEAYVAKTTVPVPPTLQHSVWETSQGITEEYLLSPVCKTCEKTVPIVWRRATPKEILEGFPPKPYASKFKYMDFLDEAGLAAVKTLSEKISKLENEVAFWKEKAIGYKTNSEWVKVGAGQDDRACKETAS